VLVQSLAAMSSPHFFNFSRLNRLKKSIVFGSSNQVSKKRSHQAAISLIEVLIVVTILAIFVLMALRQFGPQLDRARDSKRKDDLDQIAIAFENYYNDNECYPPADILNNCNGSELSPYLGAIPCDPSTKQPYEYRPYPGEHTCGGYRVYASLRNDRDDAIARLGCNQAPGCGLGEAFAGYNYGVSAGVPVYMASGEAGGGGSSERRCCVFSSSSNLWSCNHWDGIAYCPEDKQFQNAELCAEGCY
jgi:type II secretory pathway pseudopilin PulG